MVNNKNKTLAIVLGIFALVIVTTTASFAFFTYSRIGETTTTIISGDIAFTYKEGDDASLANAFPVSDLVGAQDETEEYTFTVSLTSTSTSNKMNYNVYLLDANDEENTNYFNNEHIKFALLKNGNYVLGPSSTTVNAMDAGRKLTDIDGFNEGEHNGEGLVLENQEISANTTDEYILRIWVSDDVNYSNTDEVTGQDEQVSSGKYNSYKYSLKVKVSSGVEGDVEGISINKLTITANLKDENGLAAYAITESETAPSDNSDEWVDITNTSAKGNILRTTNTLVKSKKISYLLKKNGTYYFHVKNILGEIETTTLVANAEGEHAVTKIANLAFSNPNELRIDEHEATGQQSFSTTEFRYWGVNPNNYVWFNNELWRIIGALSVDDGSKGITEVGEVSTRLKIIRADNIGKFSWDISSNNINKGYGVNEWSQADLMNTLNFGAYYNREKGKCYSGIYDEPIDCDFSETSSTPGLTSEAKEMIGDAKWYLGALNGAMPTVEKMYEIERGIISSKACANDGTVEDYCNDNVSRTTAWVGKIGLMYPTDFAYSADYSKCKDNTLLQYNKGSCVDDFWMTSYDYNWTITPQAIASYALYTSDSAVINGVNFLRYEIGVAPVTYLKNSITILDGEGTKDRPFILANE